MIGFGDGGIEAANAAEARGNRDLTHRQTGVVNQLLGKMQTTRLRYRAGRRSQMLQEQAAQMARPNSQSLGQRFHSPIFQARFR